VWIRPFSVASNLEPQPVRAACSYRLVLKIILAFLPLYEPFNYGLDALFSKKRTTSQATIFSILVLLLAYRVSSWLVWTFPYLFWVPASREWSFSFNASISRKSSIISRPNSLFESFPRSSPFLFVLSQREHLEESASFIKEEHFKQPNLHC